MKKLRMAMVGAGAIAELGHLPALTHSRCVTLGAVVDVNLDRARSVSRQFGNVVVADTVYGLAEHADFACVAVPHYVHEDVSIALLSEGLDVFIEKPLATTVSGCDRILGEAEARGRTVGVAMPRRFSPAARCAKAMIDSGLLGAVASFSLESGSAESWPAQSNYLLDPAQSGGGVLLANGCHDLDFVRWLLGDYVVTDTAMNSLARTESECSLNIRLNSGGEGVVEISRTRNLRNVIKINGKNCVLTCDLIGDHLKICTGGWSLDGQALQQCTTKLGPFSFAQIMADQIDAFAEALLLRRAPEVSGAVGRDVVALIDECYSSARLLELPWLSPIEID